MKNKTCEGLKSIVNIGEQWDVNLTASHPLLHLISVEYD